jgi:uncharacterized protein (TIGR00156 family)
MEVYMKKILLGVCLAVCLASAFTACDAWDHDDDHDDDDHWYYPVTPGNGQTTTAPAIAAAAATTVSAALALPDDALVTLHGTISAAKGYEHYTFTDATGSISVDIDHDDWYYAGLAVGDTVTIYGEVDREYGYVEIDAERIVKQ